MEHYIWKGPPSLLIARLVPGNSHDLHKVTQPLCVGEAELSLAFNCLIPVLTELIALCGDALKNLTKGVPGWLSH